VLTVGTHTVSQVILATGAHESEHFANIYKFFGRANWDPDKVAFEIFKVIVDSLLPDCTEIEVVIDDTLNNCVGKKIFGAGLQHNGNAPKTGKPIGYRVCFVIIGIAVRLPGISNRTFCLCPMLLACGGPQRPRSGRIEAFTRPSLNSPNSQFG